MSKICVIENGRSEWGIVNASGVSEVCNWAAGELQRYLKQISGAELPIGEATGPAIVLGLRSDLSQCDAALLPDSADGYDGFAVAVAGGRVVIGGDNERGVVYGVYELLERLGCRWYYPTMDPKDPEIVPKLDRVEFETGKMAIASPIKTRINNASSFFFDINPEAMIAQLDVAMKARYNGMGWQCDHRTYVGDQYKELEAGGVIGEIKKRGMMLHGPAHSFQHFLPNDLYFENHPEWFGMRDGKRVEQKFGGSQFCWSNAEARKTFIDHAEQFVLASSAIDIFCTLGFDGGPACECPECKKSTPGDLIFTLLNELIARLAVSAPHVRVETSGGYDPVHEPPKSTKADDRLRIVWAHWGRHHGMGFDDPTYCWLENLEIWRKAAKGGLCLCMYYTDNFATPWISAPYERVVEGDRRYILANKVDGIYMLMWPKGYWWNHSFNNHMAGRLFYDKDLSAREVLRDYALHYYGPDAGPLMLAYYEQWADAIDLPYRVKDDSREYDRSMLADQRKKWIDPAIAAAKNDPVYTHRVGKVAILHDTAEKLTEAHRMHDEIERLRAAEKWDEAAALLEEAKSYTDLLITHMMSVAEFNQGLIERDEVTGFIPLTIKGWVEREEKYIADRDTTIPERGVWKQINSTEMLPTQVTGQ